MTKIFEFLANNFLIFAIACGVIVIALIGFMVIAGISAKKKKQAENPETTATDSATDMSLPEATEVAAPVDFGTTPEVAPAPVATEPSLDGLNANVGGDVVAPAAESTTSEPTLVIEDTAAPVVAPEVAPAPVVTEPVATPEVAPAPVVTEPVVAPEVAPAPVATEPVATPEVAPAPVVTEPVAMPEVAPTPVVTEPVAAPEIAPAPAVAEPIATPEVAPAPAAPTETGSIFDTPNNN